MPAPADPKWRSRKWQTYYETRAEYIKHLYDNIAFAKKMLRFWEQFGLSHPSLSSNCISLIKSERKNAQDYQNELRRAVGR